MTREEIARDVLREVSEKLQGQWAGEAIMYPLNEDGDALRRRAATKAAVMDDVLNEIHAIIGVGNG